MNKLDIQRLHSLCEEGEKVAHIRRKGHTVLGLTYLASLIAIQEPVIYCLVDTYLDVSNLRTLLIEVFAAYDLRRINWIGMLHFSCNGSKIFFKNTYKLNENPLNQIGNNIPVVLLFNDPQKNFDFIKKYA